MPITLTWHDKEKLILCMRFEGRWDWDAYEVAQEQLLQLADSAPGPVGLVILVPERLTLPRDVLPRLQSELRTTHPNIAMSVIVTGNDLARSLFRLFINLNPHHAAKFRLVSTQDAALDVLREQLAHMAQ